MAYLDYPGLQRYHGKVQGEIDDLKDDLISNAIIAPGWTNNILYFGDEQSGRHYTTTRIGMARVMTAIKDFYITCDSGYNFALGKYVGFDESSLSLIISTGWLSGKYFIKRGENFYINFRKVGDSAISPLDSAHIQFVGYSDSSLVEVVDKINKQDSIRMVSSAMFEFGTVYISSDRPIYGDTNLSIRLIRDTYIDLHPGDTISINEDYQFRLIRLTDGGAVQTRDFSSASITIGMSAKYIIIIRKSNGSEVSDIEGATNSICIEEKKQVLGDSTFYSLLMQGGLSADGLYVWSDLRICTPDYIQVKSNKKYRVTINPSSETATFTISASYYTVDDFVTPRTDYIPFVRSRVIDIIVPSGIKFIRVLIGHPDNSAISPSDISSLLIEEIPVNNNDNYAVSSNFTKHCVGIEYIGKLPNATQSFVKYDDKYYSFNDSGVLSIQDESFTLLSTTTLSVGHANAFQLGHAEKAYISGWDDGKVYILNLETLEIDDIISLPVNGYTTCAVDDINKIVYIFQRTTYPITEDVYSFIIYDYENEQILKTKKLPEKFAAMQGCDFADGRIIVLNGGGTAEIPNGYRIYDTDGNIMSSFILGSFSSFEPEDVYIDRNNFDIYMTFYNQPLFKIS